MATPVTASAPAENSNPWYEERTAFDVALKDAVNELVQETTPAALNTMGMCQAVFIENGGTIPVGLPPYTLVIEAEA